MNRLRLRDLYFRYDDKTVIDGISLDFSEGNLIGVIGPNGCGKSTLLSLVAGLKQPLRGQVLLNEQPILSFKRKTLARQLAYLPQVPSCPKGMTVRQILQFGRYPYQSLLRQFSRKDEESIMEVSEALNLVEYLDRPMNELSGGQRQKAWLGLVLTQDAPIVLLDEPTSALDIGHQYEVMEHIKGAMFSGKTVIMVIHDLNTAAKFCDRLVALKSGKIFRDGTVIEVFTPETIAHLYEVEIELVRSSSTGHSLINAIASIKSPVITGPSAVNRSKGG